MRLPTTISSHPRTVQAYRDNTASVRHGHGSTACLSVQALREAGLPDRRLEEVRYGGLDLSCVR